MRKSERDSQDTAKAAKDVHTHYRYVAGMSVSSLEKAIDSSGAEAGVCFSYPQKLLLS